MINVKPNIVDKTIQYFSPVRARERYKARAALAIAESYTGASKRKRSLGSFNPKKTDADSALEFELDTLQDRSRDMVRNNPLAGSAIETSVTSVVGSGLTLDARIDYEFLGMTKEQADAWEANAEREFSIWADTVECDVERTQNFFEMQELAFRSTLESGDCFVLTPRFQRGNIPYHLKLQLVEADRCSNPSNQINSRNFSFGIERDEKGAPLKYHFSKFHPGTSFINKNSEWESIQAFGEKTHLPNVLHLFFKQRPGQSRGIPFLAPVIDTLRQLSRYTDAELTAAVVSAAFTVFIKSEADIEQILSDMSLDEKREYLKQKDEKIELGNGAVVNLLPDESIETANPGRPNTAFDPFTNAIISQIGARLNIAREILLKSFTSSYSASQAAFLETWRHFKKRRVWLAARFCQPVYELFLYEAVAIGRLSAPGFFTDPAIRKAYSGAQWFGDPMGHIDPLKSAKASTERICNLTSTIQRETIELGGDYNKNTAQIRIETDLRKELGGGENGSSSNNEPGLGN